MADTDATPTANDLEGGTLATGTFDQGNMATSGTNADIGGAAQGTGQTSGTTSTTDPRQLLKESASKYGAQATDQIRTLADTGKHKAGGALDQFSTMLTDAATQVDEKLGAQYGDYARQAAGMVSGFSDSIKNKEVDDLLDDARGFVRQSPAVAIGVAAALGFVLARLAQSGIDSPTTTGSATGPSGQTPPAKPKSQG